MEKITIFTPTYNRGYILPQLYESLKRQTSNDFIWLIIDDGSADNTSRLVKRWINEGEIQIKYHKQKNMGKSMAHNIAVKLSETFLFTCVDSDDYLCITAVEDILEFWSGSDKSNAVGILAYRGRSNGDSLTTFEYKNLKATKLKDGYKIYGLKGDTMLVFRRDILSKYEFPYFSGEKFVPEAYLYDLIDQEGKLLVLHKILYICEYLDDGYTKNMAKLITRNPNGYLAFIKQRLKFDRTIKEKILDTIRYTAICIYAKEPTCISKSIYPLITILTYPLSLAFYKMRYSKFN